MVKRALVTGGGVRVGRAISLALAEAGWDVGVHFRASEDAAEETVHRIRETAETGRRPRRGVAFRADLREPGEIDELFQRLQSVFGGLELLVNNAAVFPRTPPEEATVEEWDEVFAVNVRAPFLCARRAAALMGDTGGAIVNLADVAAFEAWPAYAPYAATKAALVSLTRSLALAWAPGVRVNAVAPGPVLLPEGTDEEGRRRAAESTALGRVGRPEDVAQAVVYLAEAPFVTGEVLRVDGGEHVKRSRGPR